MRVALALVTMAILSSVAYADGAIVVLVDRTMSSDKIATVTHALTENLAKLDPLDEIAIISYAKTARVDLPLQSVSHRARVSSVVSKITTAAESDLNAGLRAASDVFARTKRDKYLLVVTDSERATSLEPALPKLWKQNVHISTLHYQASEQSARSSIATNGGRAYPIKRGKDLARVFVWAAMERPPSSRAVVFVIDRSGSMQGPNLEAAKEATRVAIEVLDVEDRVAVVAFDSEAQVFVRPQRAANRMRISAEISRLTPGGGTNNYVGLKEAYDVLKDINASEKMVIFIGDGDAPVDGVSDLVQEMRAANITVSTVGVPGADRNVLSMIAEQGEGRLYMVEDIGALPKIFMREVSP